MKTILLFLSLIFSIQAYAKTPPRLSTTKIKQVEDTIRTYEMCLGMIRGFDQALYLTLGKSLRNSPKYKEWKRDETQKRTVVWSLKNKMYEDAGRPSLSSVVNDIKAIEPLDYEVVRLNRSLSSFSNAINALLKAKELKKITCNYRDQLNRQVLSEFPEFNNKDPEECFPYCP